MKNYTLTNDLLADIAKLRPKDRKMVMKSIGQEEWNRCARDIFYWLDVQNHPVMPYVYTKDPHPLNICNICNDGASHYFYKCALHLELKHNIRGLTLQQVDGYFTALDTTRAFTMMPYFKPIIEAWLRSQVLFIEKSRDMMATWLAVTMFTWDTIFHKGHQNIFQSEDSTKTMELVERANFIFNNQPDFLKKITPATFTRGAAMSGVMKLPTIGSEILGFPQGPDQIRQYHPSGVFQDEAALQEMAGAAFMAIKPTIQQGGRFTAVSSANPSWFMLACQDRIDEMEGTG